MNKKYTISKSCHILLLAFFGIEFAIHSVIPFHGDALFFAHSLDNGMSLCDLIISRYHTWSSRVIIESILVLVTQNVWIWRCTDSLIMVVLAWVINKLCFNETNTNNLFITIVAIMMYPFADMSTASFGATTVNYIWPLTCAIVAFLPLKYKKYNPLFLLVCILSACFAANQEQLAFVIFIVGIIFSICSIVKKDWDFYPFFCSY